MLTIKPISCDICDKFGNIVPVSLFEENEEHIIEINGKEWLRTNDYIHATILFSMIREHLTEYTSLI